MAEYLIQKETLDDIADAIRAKTGEAGTMTPGQMPGKIEGISTKEDISWHQCPQAVRNYLAYLNSNPYDPSDYSISVVDSYREDVAASNDSKPIGKTVDGVIYYNEEPNTQTPFASANVAGTLEPLDQIRWIKAYNAWSQDIRNCRDIGGWTCDGGTIKYGKMFRNGDISSYNAPVLVDELGIGAELDLDQDHLETSSKLGNVLYHGAKANIQYSLTNTEAWKDILDFVFYCVLNNIVLDFHCAVGCDRTGTLACIVEALLGVSRSDIDTDYELSSFAGTSWVRRRNGIAWPNFMNQINTLPTGLTFRDKVINWVASLGFTAAEINAFRAAMIDGTPETVTPIISTYSIIKSGSNVTFSNTAGTIDQYQPYECDITPDDGYVITGITLRVNGIDVTGLYASGDFVNHGAISITANGEVMVDGYKTAIVNVPSVAPTGTKNITDMSLTDVSSYANAQVVDADLVASNIKKGVNILGVVGTYDGGGSSVNCRLFTFTSASAVANKDVTVVSGNADVSAHYSDANAMVVVRKMTNNTANGTALIVNSNHNMGGGKYGSYVNCNSGTNNAGLISIPLNGVSTSTVGVHANASGDIVVHCLNLQNNFGGADYIIAFSW